MFKNMFPLHGKTKLAVAGVSQNGEKKWFLLVRKSDCNSRNKVIFQNWISRFPQTEQKSINKIMLFLLDR